jgi:sugar phosphate isomerase/epimerase
MVREALELGFEGVELEYRVTTSLYQEMRPQLKKAVTVLSLHNIFPKPEDPIFEKAGGDPFLLSSTDREHRAMAVQYAIRTIEHAHELEAGAVVLHLGRVDMQSPTERFKALHQERKLDENEGRAFLHEQQQIRKRSRQKNLDAVLFSLERLNKEAEKKGVFLGIENRYHFSEIPDLEEAGVLLREFKGGRLRYWHDVGHAAVQENLGIRPQEEWLQAYGGEIIGTHLHDVKGVDDHLSPGQGEVDYEAIWTFLKSASIKILEVNTTVEREALLEGRRLLEAHLTNPETLPESCGQRPLPGS